MNVDIVFVLNIEVLNNVVIVRACDLSSWWSFK